MADFQFLKDKLSGLWVVSAPRRSTRPNESKGTLKDVCPFCPGREGEEPDIYRVGGQDHDANWQIRVINNKFPFAPVHEVIIYSPDHHKGIDELPLGQVELIFQTFRQRYNTHREKGQVYIFHNRGMQAGESIPHPHTQLVVIPDDVELSIPPLDRSQAFVTGSLWDKKPAQGDSLETKHFVIFCPKTSQWPDEVWVAPKKIGTSFGDITADELSDFSQTVAKLIQIMDLRHGSDFPHNFYIAPGENWYYRLIPRQKTIGGFEVGTNVFVNTKDPAETIAFIKEHFANPDVEDIKKEHQADYSRTV